MKTAFYKLSIIIGLLVIVNNAWGHSGSIKPKFVDSLIEPYLQVQQGLSADDLDKSKAGASGIMKSIRSGPSKMGKPSILNIEASAYKIQKAKNIDQARSAFLALSEELKTMIHHVGTTSDKALFLAHCPMAFDNKGGSWIQDNESITNPYYGASMLRCGTVQKQIAGKVSKHTKASHEHGEHAHGNDSNHGAHNAELKLVPASAKIIATQGKDYPAWCVVSDEELVEGEIYDYAYGGKLIRFCCKGCKKDFLEEPATYMKKLEMLIKKSKAHAEHQH